MNEKLRIVKQFAAVFLDVVHQGVFFVRIERLIEAGMLQHRLAARELVAKDQLLLSRFVQRTDGRVARATWAEAVV